MNEGKPLLLVTDHHGEWYSQGDGLCGTLHDAGAAMPAIVCVSRIRYRVLGAHGKDVTLTHVDAGAAMRAHVFIYERWHRLLLNVVALSIP
jgi:hypothetical protein